MIEIGAELYTDFPDDIVEEDGEIIEFGDRLLTETIVAALRRLGYETADPQDMREMGWDIDLEVAKKRVWMSVRYSGEENPTLLYCEYFPGFRLFKRSHNGPFIEMLTALTAELRKDARFQDIRWKFAYQVMDGTPGSPTPQFAMR